MVLELINDPDKDVRALGFEQVRTAAPGAEATKQFAAALPKLSPEAQAGLITALADRKDPAAFPAVRTMIAKAQDESVRVAAIRAIGSLGNVDDICTLVHLTASPSKAVKAAAIDSLVRLPGKETALSIAAASDATAPEAHVILIHVLAKRRAREAVPHLLKAAVNDDAGVRKAAMAALGELAGSDSIPGMVQGVLKSKPGAERDAAERDVAEVCSRGDAKDQAVPLLEAMSKLSTADQNALLPTVGRVGRPAVLKAVEAAIADADPARHEAGLRALCNWPDASVAPRLLELAKSDPHAEHRALTLKALIRVAPLADGRSNDERLALLKQVMSLCTRDDERLQVIKRASAIRSVESLRFIMPYIDQPAFAEQACETVVELAHHRDLRVPNEAEFNRALDKVLAVSKNATTRERATRYKKGQTWVRPKAA
jgi:hypothetical protein